MGNSHCETAMAKHDTARQFTLSFHRDDVWPSRVYHDDFLLFHTVAQNRHHETTIRHTMQCSCLFLPFFSLSLSSNKLFASLSLHHFLCITSFASLFLHHFFVAEQKNKRIVPCRHTDMIKCSCLFSLSLSFHPTNYLNFVCACIYLLHRWKYSFHAATWTRCNASSCSPSLSNTPSFYTTVELAVCMHSQQFIATR